jgi:hypothetical protein
MFTNRFFNLLVALLIAIAAALALRGVGATANDTSSTNYAYDRIKQIQLEHTHPSAAKYDNSPISVYDATGAVLNAINPKEAKTHTNLSIVYRRGEWYCINEPQPICRK